MRGIEAAYDTRLFFPRKQALQHNAVMASMFEQFIEEQKKTPRPKTASMDTKLDHILALLKARSSVYTVSNTKAI